VDATPPTVQKRKPVEKATRRKREDSRISRLHPDGPASHVGAAHTAETLMRYIMVSFHTSCVFCPVSSRSNAGTERVCPQFKRHPKASSPWCHSKRPLDDTSMLTPTVKLSEHRSDPCILQHDSREARTETTRPDNTNGRTFAGPPEIDNPRGLAGRVLRTRRPGIFGLAATADNHVSESVRSNELHTIKPSGETFLN